MPPRFALSTIQSKQARNTAIYGIVHQAQLHEIKSLFVSSLSQTWEKIMAAESTFDIVSEFDRQELVNAVDQAQREINNRYDLKDSQTDIVLGEKELTITTSSEMYLDAARDILQTKIIRRNLSLKILKFEKVEEIGGLRVRQVGTLQQGMPEDTAKKLQKMIREQFPKVQPRIHGTALRVGSKNKDELQSVIRLVKERQDDFPVPLQFTNYR